MLTLTCGIFLPGLVRLRLIPWLLFLSIASLLMAADYYGWSVTLLKLPPLFVLCVIGGVFWYSLLPGNTPLVTNIGEKARGPLSPELRRYTLWVTRFWALVLAAQLTVTLMLSLAGPLWLWALVANVANLIVVAILFVLEFLFRRHRFPGHNHPNFVDYIKIVVNSNVKKPS